MDCIVFPQYGRSLANLLRDCNSGEQLAQPLSDNHEVEFDRIEAGRLEAAEYQENCKTG